MTPGPAIELGSHWWKASALTTTPSLFPCETQTKNLCTALYCVKEHNTFVGGKQEQKQWPSTATTEDD